jgi:alpha-D-xyloside xylohydrolase
MSSFIRSDQGVLVSYGHEVLLVEAWGPDSIRVRATLGGEIVETPGSALMERQDCDPTIEISADRAVVRNGNLIAEVRHNPQESFIEFPPLVRFLGPDGRELFAESVPHFTSPPQRRYLPSAGGLYHCDVTFDAYEGERFYGLGQHQHGLLDQKGIVLDLIQRNTEVSIPFVLSNRGYGMLWNMPGTGRVELGTNRTRWVADGARQIDYWVTAAPRPSQIVARYVQATGLPPMIPDWALGFWQSKLRYLTQDELLEVAREYKRRGLPLDVIVIDYFHWTKQGEWRFDPSEWPDPQAMVDELRSLGVELVVSIWPTVNPDSANYAEMSRRGFLVGNLRGIPLQLPFWDKGNQGRVFVSFYDATNPQARRFVWERVKEGYRRYGIRGFWLDACEPEMRPEDPESNIYHLGPGRAVQCLYPREHARGFADGLSEDGEQVLLLCRSAWAGSQRYGAAVWSGDIDSTFEALARQIPAGLNIAVSGIPWWTTDIGGFKGSDPESEYFRELIVRWFQYGVFCPLFRLHGVRGTAKLIGAGQTGSPNEVWSFGDDAYHIIKEQLHLRERLRPYIRQQMSEAATTGIPPMRPLFLEFPDEPAAWEVADEFMLGPELLVAPITSFGSRQRQVYLPEGASWRDAWSGQVVKGDGWIEVYAPVERIPVFVRDDSAVLEVFRDVS